MDDDTKYTLRAIPTLEILEFLESDFRDIPRPPPPHAAHILSARGHIRMAIMDLRRADHALRDALAEQALQP